MALEIHDCHFGYRSKPVINGLSYRLPSGTTVLLGPNGAGKSTLLSLMASVHRPRSGRITYNGVASTSRRYRRLIAWMPQHITAIPGLTAREQVAYTGWAKGMSNAHAWEQAALALGRVDLTAQSDVRSSALSGGQLRRVGVAQALVHQAEVLLLDEPTAGMDPHQRRLFRDMLARLENVTVLLSTHDVADLAEEADHVAVLSGGALAFEGTTEGFCSHAPQGTPAARTPEAAYSALCGSLSCQ